MTFTSLRNTQTDTHTEGGRSPLPSVPTMKRMSAIRSLLNMAAFRSRIVLLVACQLGSPVSVVPPPVVVLVMTLLLVEEPPAPPVPAADADELVVVSGRQNDVELMAPGEVMVGDDGALQG